MRHQDKVTGHANERQTSHARIYCDNLASIRAIAAFRGVTVAELIDELMMPQLPASLELKRECGQETGPLAV